MTVNVRVLSGEIKIYDEPVPESKSITPYHQNEFGYPSNKVPEMMERLNIIEECKRLGFLIGIKVVRKYNANQSKINKAYIGYICSYSIEPDPGVSKWYPLNVKFPDINDITKYSTKAWGYSPEELVLAEKLSSSFISDSTQDTEDQIPS